MDSIPEEGEENTLTEDENDLFAIPDGAGDLSLEGNDNRNMQSYVNCAVAATLVSIGTAFILDALYWLGIDLQDNNSDSDNEEEDEELIEEDSGTEDNEDMELQVESHPEFGEGDLLPVALELPLQISSTVVRKRRSRWTGWRKDRGRKRWAVGSFRQRYKCWFLGVGVC